MTEREREDTIERIERVLVLTHKDSITVTIPRLTAERAVSLLKEQEAVEPIPLTDESDLWKCGNCHHQLFRCTHQKYCEMCGRAVKWK